ncbi:hypothetical protein OUZ56_002035 [Daphnia magna]|uniref:Uncharacterized protein n=1 Tax=Daphnia magna TaxID=35525 RepID=A0ABR0A4V6_9CRUS|nr:hypothetical protein OUZ56_002035 [Daphnia magna]
MVLMNLFRNKRRRLAANQKSKELLLEDAIRDEQSNIVSVRHSRGTRKHHVPFYLNCNQHLEIEQRRELDTDGRPVVAKQEKEKYK